jgi:hypothetical protein
MKKPKTIAAAKHRWRHLQESWMQLKEIQERMQQQPASQKRRDWRGPVTAVAQGRPRGCILVAQPEQQQW